MEGGRVESITVPAAETSTFDGGVGSGNLWKTVNNGTTWTPIFEKESTFAIGDVAVAESDPNVVWVRVPHASLQEYRGQNQPRLSPAPSSSTH